jgi:hypothetical protein
MQAGPPKTGKGGKPLGHRGMDPSAHGGVSLHRTVVAAQTTFYFIHEDKLYQSLASWRRVC